MSRRVLIRAALFLIFSFLVLAGIAAENINKANRYKEVIDDVYGYAFAELTADITKLDYALMKSNYATTAPLLTSLCAEIYRESSSSMAALSQLPVAELNLENTARFLSRTGDYAMNISKKVARGESLSASERDELRRMSEGASDIKDMLYKLLGEIEEKKINISDIKLESGAEPSGTTRDIAELEREFSEYPVLIYDGPFSDHIEKREPSLIKDMPEISENEAKEKASQLLGLPADELISDGMRKEGTSEIYSFHRDFDGYSTYADVTKSGGKLLRIISSREVKNAKYTVKEAVEKAKDILLESGFENMKETYHIRYGNSLTINFAATENGTVLYPDLVKVTMALDDMSILNLDASGYIMNHKERVLRDISADSARASEVVSEELKILSYSMAVIPTDAEGEVLVHEFKCENTDGGHCIVYVNEKSYEEEKILILLEDENGTLVM